MRSNLKNNGPSTKTHEGAEAMRISAYKELRRSVLTALLWEDSFYETGSEHAARVKALVSEIEPEKVAALAIEARNKMYLRHVPLYLVREMARTKGNGTLVAETLSKVIQRPDELCEYIAIYWKGQNDKEKDSLSAGSKRGLARAFAKFNGYSLAKYDRDNSVKLRDVLRLCHVKPDGRDKSILYKQVLDRTLPTPDTWEVELSAGKDKKATFERLLMEDKLGGLAFLRNLRNMIQSNVDTDLINQRFKGNFNKVLPFRFVAALRYAPQFAKGLDLAMQKSLVDIPKLKGKTAILVDVSGSMSVLLSAKSEMLRVDVAAGLAIIVAGVADNPRVFTFSNRVVEVPAYSNLSLVKSIRDSQANSGTELGKAVRTINDLDIDRLIVITDEQSQDAVGAPKAPKSYLINVAAYKNGVGYGKAWTHIDGFSERVLDFIQEIEND